MTKRNQILLSAALTLLGVWAAYETRGYFAIGGEWSVPVWVMLLTNKEKSK